MPNLFLIRKAIVIFIGSCLIIYIPIFLITMSNRDFNSLALILANVSLAIFSFGLIICPRVKINEKIQIVDNILKYALAVTGFLIFTIGAYNLTQSENKNIKLLDYFISTPSIYYIAFVLASMASLYTALRPIMIAYALKPGVTSVSIKDGDIFYNIKLEVFKIQGRDLFYACLTCSTSDESGGQPESLSLKYITENKKELHIIKLKYLLSVSKKEVSDKLIESISSNLP